MAAALRDPAGAPRDGISVLGGVPFAQPAGLAALLEALDGLHRCVYTGYTYAALRRLADAPTPTGQAIARALRATDLLVDGPFARRLAGGAGLWRGSRNQRFLPLRHGRPRPATASSRSSAAAPVQRETIEEPRRRACTHRAIDAVQEPPAPASPPRSSSDGPSWCMIGGERR